MKQFSFLEIRGLSKEVLKFSFKKSSIYCLERLFQSTLLTKKKLKKSYNLLLNK